MDDLIQAPKHSDLIYDIGMHRAEDTGFYLRKGFRVVAFEADPDNANFGRKKFAEFIDRGQLKIVEGAILSPEAAGKGQKKVSFYKNQNDSRWGTVCVDWAERNERFGTASGLIEVEVVDFEDALKQH